MYLSKLTQHQKSHKNKNTPMNANDNFKEVPISGKIIGQNDLTCNECKKTFKYCSKLKQHQKAI
jgi:hypothetical protein